MRGGLFWGSGIAYASGFDRVGETQTVCRFQRSSGVLLHVSSLPGRPARPRGVPLRRLARRGGPVVVGAAAARRRPTRPARRTRRRRPSPPMPASSSGRSARVTHRRARGVRRPASATGSPTGRPSRAPARSPTRCASTASGARCAATPAERGVRLFGDVPIYVAQRRRRRRGAPGALPSRLVAGAPPDGLSAFGQRWGNPLYDWQHDARAGLPLVDRAVPADVRALRRRAHRPLPRLRRLLGGPGAPQDRQARPVPAAAPAPSSSARPSASSGRSRWSPRTSA